MNNNSGQFPTPQDSGVSLMPLRLQQVRLCFFEGCSNVSYRQGRCLEHLHDRRCKRLGCNSSARTKHLCFAHGGGRRCCVIGCNSGAVGGNLCKRHGGGARCRALGCTRSSVSKSLCFHHGGGKRCSVRDCTSRPRGSQGLCPAHQLRYHRETQMSQSVLKPSKTLERRNPMALSTILN